MSLTIELGTQQSAAAHQCGSCGHFEPRSPGDGFGYCHFKLQPWAMRKVLAEMWEVDPRTVRDTETCSFYKPKMIGGEHVTFVQKHSWRAGD